MDHAIEKRLPSADAATYLRVAPEMERRVRSLLGSAIRRSGMHRQEIEARMSSALGAGVTLVKFTRNATRKNNARFPLAWLPAFCEAVGDWWLLREILPGAMKSALAAAEQISDSRRALLKALAAIEALEDRHPKARRRRRK